jgi:hypothetical protein
VESDPNEQLLAVPVHLATFTLFTVLWLFDSADREVRERMLEIARYAGISSVNRRLAVRPSVERDVTAAAAYHFEKGGGGGGGLALASPNRVGRVQLRRDKRSQAKYASVGTRSRL